MENNERSTQVFVWGSNNFGQLGLGSSQGRHRYSLPKSCTFNVIIRSVSCGEEHSAFITNTGAIYTMGSNADGRLGIGDKTVKAAPTPCLVEGLSSFNAIQVACGMGHTVAVIDNGKLYSWGMGQYGALGISDCESQWFPVQIVFDERVPIRIKNASCGTRHTAMVDYDGNVFACGANDAGQLGIGTREGQSRPIKISSLTTPILKVACGILHTLLLTTSGSLLGMGGNHLGQLGTGDKRSSKVPIPVKGFDQLRIATISAGKISAAVTEEGRLLVWGTGTFGERLFPAELEGIKGNIKDIQINGACTLVR